MNAEEILLYLKKCIEDLDKSSDDLEFEPIILPTKGDPTELQNDVSIIIMEKVGVVESLYPRLNYLLLELLLVLLLLELLVFVELLVLVEVLLDGVLDGELYVFRCGVDDLL